MEETLAFEFLRRTHLGAVFSRLETLIPSPSSRARRQNLSYWTSGFYFTCVWRWCAVFFFRARWNLHFSAPYEFQGQGLGDHHPYRDNPTWRVWQRGNKTWSRGERMKGSWTSGGGTTSSQELRLPRVPMREQKQFSWSSTRQTPTSSILHPGPRQSHAPRNISPPSILVSITWKVSPKDKEPLSSTRAIPPSKLHNHFSVVLCCQGTAREQPPNHPFLALHAQAFHHTQESQGLILNRQHFVSAQASQRARASKPLEDVRYFKRVKSRVPNP